MSTSVTLPRNHKFPKHIMIETVSGNYTYYPLILQMITERGLLLPDFSDADFTCEALSSTAEMSRGYASPLDEVYTAYTKFSVQSALKFGFFMSIRKNEPNPIVPTTRIVADTHLGIRLMPVGDLICYDHFTMSMYADGDGKKELSSLTTLSLLIEDFIKVLPLVLAQLATSELWDQLHLTFPTSYTSMASRRFTWQR